MNARKIVGWNVRKLRVDRRMTIEELAVDADVDPSYVGRIERASVNASIDLLERLAKQLKVRMADLFVEPATSSARPAPLSAGRRRR